MLCADKDGGSAPGGSERPSGLRRGEVLLLVAVAAVLAVMRLDAASTLNLFTDEILYAWTWTVAPLNFSPHPPGVPMLAASGMALLGRTDLGVRLGAWILGTLVAPLMFLLGRAVADSRAGFWAALQSLCVPLFFAFGVILTPDGPLLVLWLAGLIAAWHALESGRMRWWCALGVIVGAGLHTKYMMVFLPASLAVCMGVVPEWRRHWRAAGPWAALAIVVAIFVPVWAWTESHTGWQALRYHLSSRQEWRGPSIRDFLEYYGIHAVYYSPVLYGGTVAAGVWALVSGWRSRNRRLLFLGIFAGLIFVFFAVVGAFTKRELSREQWDAPAYAAALPAFVLMVRRGLAAGRHRRAWRTLAVGAPALGAVVMVGAYVEFHTDLVSRAMGRRPLLQSVTRLRPAVAQADAGLAALPAGTAPMLVANSFHSVLAHWFYGRTDARRYTLDHASHQQYGVTHLLERAGMTEGLMPVQPGGDAVFFAEPANSRVGQRGAKLSRLFTSVSPMDGTETTATAKLDHVTRVYICRGYKGRRPAPVKP